MPGKYSTVKVHHREMTSSRSEKIKSTNTQTSQIITIFACESLG